MEKKLRKRNFRKWWNMLMNESLGFREQTSIVLYIYECNIVYAYSKTFC